MALPNVFNLLCQAVKDGSVSQLSVIRKSDSWETIPLNIIVNHRNQEGDTLLQVAVKGGHFDVVEFLAKELKHQIYPEWKKKYKGSASCPVLWSNFKQVLPSASVLSEAVYIRDISGQIPIIKLIEYLIEPEKDEFLWLEFVLSSITASSVSRQEMIVAFELMGVFLIIFNLPPLNRFVLPRRYDRSHISRGLNSWKQAMALRYSSDDGLPVIPKIPCSVLPDLSRSVFGNVDEFRTTKELEQLELQFLLGKEIEFSEETTIFRGPIVTQAFLVGQRIFSQANTCPNPFYLEALNIYGKENHSNGQCDRAFNTYQLILEQSHGFDSTFPPNCVQVFDLTLSSISNFFLSQQLRYNYDITLWIFRDKLSSTNALLFIKLCIKVLTNLLIVPPITSSARDWQLKIMEQVFCCILDYNEPSRRGFKQDLRLKALLMKKCLSTYLHLNNINSFTSLFHLAVEKNNYFDASPTSRITTIKQFLEAGADPTVTDKYGKTPLHILAETSQWDYIDESSKNILLAMIDAGGHLDQATPDGKTIVSILKDIQEKQENRFGFKLPINPLLESLPNTVHPLSCYCAQVIRKFGIPFEDKLPPKLQSFVLLHSSTVGCYKIQ